MDVLKWPKGKNKKVPACKFFIEIIIFRKNLHVLIQTCSYALAIAAYLTHCALVIIIATLANTVHTNLISPTV